MKTTHRIIWTAVLTLLFLTFLWGCGYLEHLLIPGLLFANFATEFIGCVGSLVAILVVWCHDIKD